LNASNFDILAGTVSVIDIAGKVSVCALVTLAESVCAFVDWKAISNKKTMRAGFLLI
jgi:hypothetical protein